MWHALYGTFDGHCHWQIFRCGFSKVSVSLCCVASFLWDSCTKVSGRSWATFLSKETVCPKREIAEHSVFLVALLLFADASYPGSSQYLSNHMVSSPSFHFRTPSDHFICVPVLVCMSFRVFFLFQKATFMMPLIVEVTQMLVRSEAAMSVCSISVQKVAGELCEHTPA